MKYITIEQLLQFHVLVLLKDGGMEGVRDIGRLEAAVAVQEQQVFGKDIYPTDFHKAAALLRGIVADHPFYDGNKRTAILASLTLLELNGYTVTLQAGELVNFAVQVAVERLEVETIARWLEEHCEGQTGIAKK